MVLPNQSTAEEKAIYRVNPHICTDVPHASISTSFLKHERISKPWKGQKGFSSICLSQTVINPVASL